jgi:hypothetical protein
MKRSGTYLAGVAFVLIASLTARAQAAVTVNGDLSDWGVTLNGSNQLEFSGGVVNNPVHPGNSGTIDNFLGNTWKLYWGAEDQSDTAGDGGALGPNSGGQNYDVEFIGAFIEGTTLTIAISTGQRPDNGLARFSPGDLRIETNNGLYGVEMGGGAGDTSRTDGSIDLGDTGTTYELKSSGFTISATDNNDPEGLRKAGSVWLTEEGDWILDPLVPKDPAQLNPTQLIGGDYVGDADEYIYSYASALGQHAFIEIRLDMSLFANGINLSDLEILSISWDPSCGNDILDIPVGDSPNVIPEPASVAVWGTLSMLGLVYGRRKRQIQKRRSAA